MTSKLYILILIACLLVSLNAKGQQYVVAELQKGEGGYALLRRYGLDVSPCNLTEFYRINGLTYGSALTLGKKYNVPVKIFQYNKSSIRSTVKNFDLVKALEVERYNKWLQTQNLKPVYFLQDLKLWVPYYVYNCNYDNLVLSTQTEKPQEKTTTSPPAEVPKKEEIKKNTLDIPLFGDKHRQVEILGNELRGQVFYIKSGHGGPDPGAMAKIDDKIYCEDEYAYDIALRLGRELIQHGAIVHFIVYDPDDGIRDEEYLPCDKDELHAGKREIQVNQIQRLRTRVQIINDFYASYRKKGINKQKFISIHIDSRNESLELDTHFYYQEGSKVGQDMAVNTQAVFEKKFGELGSRKYTGTVKARDLYVVKYSQPPCLFVEVGNIQNVNDQKRILDPDNRQTLADWLYEGITK